MIFDDLRSTVTNEVRQRHGAAAPFVYGWLVYD